MRRLNESAYVVVAKGDIRDLPPDAAYLLCRGIETGGAWPDELGQGWLADLYEGRDTVDAALQRAIPIAQAKLNGGLA